MNKAEVRASSLPMRSAMTETTNDYLAEWSCANVESALDQQNQTAKISAPVMQAGLSMVVWILKREVRAIGGCLGIHRR